MNKKTAMGLLVFAALFLTGCSSGLIQRAESRYTEQEYKAAAGLLELYLDENPDAELARRKLGHSYLKEGRPREAADQFEKVIRDRPYDTFAHLYLGLAYLRLGDYQKALTVWRQLEVTERPLIAEAKANQISLVAEMGPNISSDDELNELAEQVETAMEDAFFAEQQRAAYNAARLGDCG